jgi:hypothetical protein
LPTQQSGIDDGSMSRLAERHPIIARIPAAAYRAIHRWCAAHDVERGGTTDHIYDAPTGGAINVWSEPWDTRERRARSELRGTYYHERDDGLSQGAVLEATVRALSEGRTPRGVNDPTGLSGSEEILPARTCLVVWEPGYEPEYVWTAEEARTHFATLYRRVIGEPLPDEAP